MKSFIWSSMKYYSYTVLVIGTVKLCYPPTAEWMIYFTQVHYPSELSAEEYVEPDHIKNWGQLSIRNPSYSCPMRKCDENSEKYIFGPHQKSQEAIRCGPAARVERTYFQGNPTRIELRASVLREKSQNRKKPTAPYVPQSAVRKGNKVARSWYKWQNSPGPVVHF